MSYKKVFSFFIACHLLVLLSGCSGTTNNILSKVTGVVDDIKANNAVSKAEKAYEKGDYKSAFTYFREASDLGDSYGQFMLANMYLSGEGTKSNKQAYVQWLEKSAEGGYPPANYLVGVGIHSNNPKDAALAIKYLEKAAQAEHVGAMHMLGLIWATGTGVKKNHKEALRWFREAKAYGLPVDQRLLSETGIAVYVQDLERSAPPYTSSSKAKKLVKQIQQGLKDLGYDPGPVDGLYGGKTKAAIEALQRDSGMPPDGQASQAVLDLIRKHRK